MSHSTDPRRPNPLRPARRLAEAAVRLAARRDASGLSAPANEALDSSAPPYFEIYRADRVKLTSILFSGEDWRWRFCSGAGQAIASGGGFGTERECASAVDALRKHAATAPVRVESAPN